MPGPFVGSLGPFRPISMVDQIHIDVGIKGRITSPRAQIRWHERDRASWYCLASDCRGKKLAATADCNEPVNFSRVSNIDQRGEDSDNGVAMIHSRIVGVQRTIKNSKIICELSSTLTGKPHRPTQQRNDKLALTNSANPVCLNVPWSSVVFCSQEIDSQRCHSTPIDRLLAQ
jgi:hypothetical protein